MAIGSRTEVHIYNKCDPTLFGYSIVQPLNAALFPTKTPSQTCSSKAMQQLLSLINVHWREELRFLEVARNGCTGCARPVSTLP